jgi:hypothetical protein
LECVAEGFHVSIFPNGRAAALAECHRQSGPGEPAA